MFFYVERFCLSCHGDALWADTSGGNRLCWLILLLHVCMCSHVAHINTHTQTNVQYGAFEEWVLLTEPQLQPLKNIAMLKNTSLKEELEPPKTRWWGIYVLNGRWMNSLDVFFFFFFFYSQHNAIHSLQVSRQSDGYERENFHVIFLAQNHASFLSFFFKLDQEFFLLSLLLFKAKFSCISVSAQDLIDLWFFYLALLFSKELIRWWDCIPLNLNVPVWKLFLCCAD